MGFTYTNFASLKSQFYLKGIIKEWLPGFKKHGKEKQDKA